MKYWYVYKYEEDFNSYICLGTVGGKFLSYKQATTYKETLDDCFKYTIESSG